MYYEAIHPKFIEYKVHKDHYMDDHRWRVDRDFSDRSRVIWLANDRALIIVNVTDEEACFLAVVRSDAKVSVGSAVQRRYFSGKC